MTVLYFTKRGPHVLMTKRFPIISTVSEKKKASCIKI